MQMERSAGILLHPTSLPGIFGIGDLGDQAYKFVDFLEKSGLKLWQTLAFGPTGYADSPYSTLSAFAGNPMLIDPKRLAEEDGDLRWDHINNPPPFPRSHVDFGWVINWKIELFREAAATFRRKKGDKRKEQFEEFCQKNDSWLDDYALFMALKSHHNLSMWNTWDKSLVHREESNLATWKAQLTDEVFYHKYLQWQFFKQWGYLKAYANHKGIKIIGDIPIFVAEDSVDVWANQHFFHVNPDGLPIFIAGVPPDYFSKTGQRWGNPLYRWDKMQESNFSWWTKRVEHQFNLVDILRIDHFRGFEAYWEIPAEKETAIKGRWVKAPGTELFQHLKNHLGDLPIIAEDLGVITDEVIQLRDQFNFPGMKVLQFAFEGNKDFLPHQIDENSIVYTGTHDNDTSLGWYQASDLEKKEYFHSYTGSNGTAVSWEFLRMAFMCDAKMAVVPMQDVLNLGGEARMNIPGKTSGNWSWRFWEGALTDTLAKQLNTLVMNYNR